MKVLLTFTGFHDPYSPGLIGEEEQAGPILSLISAKSFDKIILFSTPNTETNTRNTATALNSLHPNLDVEVIALFLSDPTDYISILNGLRPSIRKIIENYTNSEYYISVASGTPQMHACWLLLSASGEIPARILHVRPHKFVSKDKPVVSEVDLNSNEFPIIRPNICRLDIPDIPTPELDWVVSQLGIVGDHPSMRKALEEGAILASSDLPVLILGETGTGKELFARYIHLLSKRHNKPFIPINCGAIPEGIVESYLFGHKKGSFTGAINDQSGKFDRADGGTFFLDELAELSLAIQVKLLRVLQDGVIEPIGGQESHAVDVRVVAATNKNIKEALRKGLFREDLYYRLNVGEISLPALRERKADVVKIALNLLDRINTGLRHQKSISPEALNRLQNYSWPGNVRELQNVIERSVLRARERTLMAKDILMPDPQADSNSQRTIPDPHQGFLLSKYLNSIRKNLIFRALELSDGNKSAAAKLLGLSPQAVHKFSKNMKDI